MRSRHRPILLCLVTALLTAPAAAPESASPYAGSHERPIKALAAEQIDDLLSGHGMGLALAAELNGYPGPRHVLDLADELELTAEQRAETEALFEAVRAEAVRLGERIVEREAALDRLFAWGEATDAAVRKVAGEIGRLRGELRAVHLGAHLTMRGLLTPRQVARYTEIRGYGSTSHGHGHGGHAGHQ